MRRPRLLASLALVVVAGALLAFQPLRSEWWTGYDFDSVYVASGLTLFRGEQSTFFDHPGVPLQEALGAAFTAGWLLEGADESRAERADRWLLDLDSTRPYLRAFGALLFLGSALIVLLVVTALTGSALWGFLGGVLFMGAPSLIDWAAVTKPDALLAALSVAVVGLLAVAATRRSLPSTRRLPRCSASRSR